MGIKLKSKFKKYLSNIWLIEIFLVVFSIGYVGIEAYEVKNNQKESKLFSMIELAISPNSYYEDKLSDEIDEIDYKLYSDYIFLHAMKKASSTSLSRDSSTILSEYIDDEIKFVFRNKETGNILTNDMDSNLSDNYFDVESYDSQLSSEDKRKEIKEDHSEKDNFEVSLEQKKVDFIPGTEEIGNYISNKYKNKEVSIYYDNDVNSNPFFQSKPKYVSKTILKDAKSEYEEYYYTSVQNYYNKFDSGMANIVVTIMIIIIVITIKILLVLLMNKGRIKVRGNFIASMIYVMRYGFKYKQTRKTLLISIIGLSIFFIGYLYLLAVGGYENNVVVTFFERYPFKGSFLLMILPMIGIIYSNKKSIDIYLVNERLKEINKGNLDYEIVERGSTEIVELIQNIIKIKDGYKIAVEETLKNEKMKTELISNVSHDLRTPLTSIINYVNILAEESLTNEERIEYLSILEQKSKKLKVLIDDLFEMSKINSGKMEINKERIEIISLIHQSIGEYSYLYEDKNVQFIVECDLDEIFINLDGKLMSRVFENLVINALKYSLEGTRIYVEIKECKNNVEVSIKNIANYNMEFNNNDVLERFVRGDKSRNSKVEGSGLGLAITKSIVELHNGRVNIIREGDMFKIYIILPKE